MPSRTRGEHEAEFTRAIIKFEKEYMGRGPLEARTFFVQDMILVRLRGVLTPAERKLTESAEGRALVKEARRQLFETSRPMLAAIVADLLGSQVISMHTDLSTRQDERIVVLTLDQNLSAQFD